VVKLNQICVNTLIGIVNSLHNPPQDGISTWVETGLVLKEVHVNSWCSF